MTDPTADRRAELIAAAASSDLSPGEAAELDALRLADSSIDVEIAELRAAIRALDGLHWDDSAPGAGLRDRVVAIDTAPVVTLAPRRRWIIGLGAAACILAGVGLGLGAGALAPSGAGPQPGAPGALGALEHVEFEGQSSDVSIDGSLVAHTWGTETILEIDGLAAGDSYSVVLIGPGGESFDSGSFLGSSVTIDCRMNAAVERPDVDSVEIRDASGTVVAAAELPAVES